jgi:diaminohydroxyphosphoribosylaminopyrimidine deaminase/5-amino-6-(5-phosphoribosylamino)uracil reductase
MVITQKDIGFLKIALKLASKGSGHTNPNPMVGAVIVKNNKEIARGFHKKYGGLHAEIEAIKNAKTEVQGATMYVNLEPCCHTNKQTPPCTEAIISAGIKKVVCCTVDPNKNVSGKGIKFLRAAGIKVEVGALAKEAKYLNAAFFCFHQKKRPLVIIKFACSADGKIATKTGDSKWITNTKARGFARNLRGEFQAIMVGTKTVLKDNPHLGAQDFKNRDPKRIILDAKLEIGRRAKVYRDNNVLVFTSRLADKQKIESLKEKGVEVVVLKQVVPPAMIILRELYKRKIISVFVEGGAELQGSFVDKKLVDKFYIFYSPIIIGGKKAKSLSGEGIKKIIEAIYLKNTTLKTFGDNWMISGTV